ncbi:MAG: hypothetical protein WCD75_20400, partial [Rhodoplanes sp.]
IRLKQDDALMPTMKRLPLSQECIEARIVLRVAQLRELAAWTACEYWRQRKGADRFSMRGLARCRSGVAARHRRPPACANCIGESVHRAENQGNVGVTAGKAA